MQKEGNFNGIVYRIYMRKWVIGFIVVLVVFIASAYALIPSRMVLAESVTLNASQYSAFRCLTSASVVRQWWKDDNTTIAAADKNGVTVTTNKTAFTLKPQVYNVVGVDIKNDKEEVKSFITILPLKKDSMLVQWKAELPTTNNVFTRIQEYVQARQLKKNMSAVLNQFAQFMKNEDQVYGLKIQLTQVTDTMLVMTKMSSPSYPATVDYYNLVQKLQQYIAQHGAQETNYPMLNITAVDTGRFETMVAIPVNKIIPSSGDVFYKRMIPGKILTAEVRGGKGSIAEGFRQMDLYISENDLTQPAIPFQSLVTNRLTESDTSKWMTKLYYPVL